MKDNNLVELMVIKERQMFPKGRIYNNDGEYAIITFRVEETIKGEPKINKTYGTITVKGNMPPIKLGKVYHLLAQETYDERYKNYSYEVSYIGEKISVMEDIEDIRIALEEVTSEKLAREIVKLDNIKDILKNKDVESLMKINGIGEVLSVKIIEKYHEKIKFGMYLIKLSKIGLTKTVLDSLIERYSNYETIYNKIKENPYILADEIKGIGFVKADALAEKFNIPQNSPNRIREYVKHLLKEKANEGKSFVLTKEVLALLRSNTDESLYPITREVITETFNKMRDKNELWWNDNKSVLALPRVRKTEEKIAEHLIRLLSDTTKHDLSTWEETVRAIEKRKGFNYTEEQKEGIKTVLTSPVVVVTGLAGCVDCDTEFFNGVEWKKISDYKEGDMVLQYNLDGSANLTKPKSFVKKECEEMTLITNKSGRINQCLSDEHNVVYLTSKNNIAKKPFYKIKKQHLESEAGFNGRFITTFNYGGKGINMSDDEIRVATMVIADGSFARDTNRCHLSLKKQRKIDRALDLLNRANINYEIAKKKNGFTLIKFDSPLRAREFEDFWYESTNEQLKVICDEVLKWDGSLSNNRMRFTTTSKKTADFVQFAFSSTGKRATISIKNRVGEVYKDGYIRKSVEYDIHISKGSTLLSIRGDKRRNFEDKARMDLYKTKDGYKYCFEVESSMLVLRRENRVFITGNTGKTSVLEPMTSIFVDQQGKKLTQCALSGKASQRMKEVTGYKAETVHSTLEYNPRNITPENPTPFGYNENNPLETDIIIWDEFSMADANLVASLLEAIPTGTKPVFVGDYGQLQCIGFGDVLLDLIKSGIVPVVKLTQVHRQAQASAIITESIKIRNQEQIIKPNEEGHKILGELQDLEIDVTSDKDNLQRRVVKYFKEGLEREKGDIMEVQVVCATRTRGDLSTFEINNIIKNLVNPIKEDEPQMCAECRVDKKHIYKITEGDKIIITKNNRRAWIWNEECQEFFTGMVCNGNMGIVQNIQTNHMDVEIVGVGLVRIEQSDYNNVELAYAVTCHKCVVGSTIVLTDSGIKTIEDVVKSKNSKVYNGEELETPSDYISIGKEKVIRVVTSRGYEIIGTRDHRLDVLDKEGNISVKTIEELENNDSLLLRINSGIYGNNKLFPSECYNTSKLDTRSKIYKYPSELTSDMSELLGMLVADGTLGKKFVKFSKRHLDVSERFSKIIEDNFGYKVEPKLRPSGDYMCEIGSTYIANFFNNIEGLKPHKKNIPSIILESTEENQRAFLRGLFEDGTVNVKKGKFDHVELTMGKNSEKLVKMVQQMLLNMGIVSTFRKIEGKNEKNVIYIYKDYSEVFLNKIGFISRFKQERLKKCLEKGSRNSDRKAVPYILEIMRQVAKKYDSINISDKSLKTILFSKSNKSTKTITKTMLKRFLENYGHLDDENIEYLKRFFVELYVDKIEIIEDSGEQEVYCVTMPKTHKFTQNGFMAWNCQGSQANSVVVAIDSSAWIMLCCEWLYTAITRAKKHCALVGETKAVRRCCSNAQGNSKLTFLPTFLEEKYSLVKMKQNQEEVESN